MNASKSARRRFIAPCLAAGVLFVSGPVRAEFVIVAGNMGSGIELEVDLDKDGIVDIHNEAFDQTIFPSPQFATLTHIRTDPSTALFGEGAAYQNQFGINAVFVDSRNGTADGGNFYGYAVSSYNSEVRSTVDIASPVPFTFVINSGELRVKNIDNFDTVGSVATSKVTVVASVEVSNISNRATWTMAVVLERNGVGGPFTVMFDPARNLDSHNLGFPTLTVNLEDVNGDGVNDDAVVTIPRIEKTIMIDPDDLRARPFTKNIRGPTVSYTMFANAELFGALGASAVAGITDPFALGTPNDASDDLGGNFSPLGVQFFLDGRPLSDFQIVPEPSSLALLSVGCLILTRRRTT